jgi:hypothetical protein
MLPDMSLHLRAGGSDAADSVNLDSLGELRDAAVKLGRHEAHYRQLSGNCPPAIVSWTFSDWIRLKDSRVCCKVWDIGGDSVYGTDIGSGEGGGHQTAA